MGRKKAPSKMPYLKPPFKPIFQTLPPELLHVIFSKLSIEDILALRTSCSVLASVGLDHLEDEIPSVFHRDKFKALTEIAEHPKLSKQMRSLFYVVNRCKVQSFEKWDHCRPDPHPEDQEDYDRDAKFYTERDFRACAREGKKDFYKFLKRMAAVPDSERRSAYERFCALCQDIADVEDEGYDLSCLRLLFEKCPRIREVMIGSQMGIVRRSSEWQCHSIRRCHDRALQGPALVDFRCTPSPLGSKSCPTCRHKSAISSHSSAVLGSAALSIWMATVKSNSNTVGTNLAGLLHTETLLRTSSSKGANTRLMMKPSCQTRLIILTRTTRVRACDRTTPSQMIQC